MSLTLDGKRPEELGLKLLQEHQHPALPETRDRSVEIPGKHGAYDFGADLGVRPFELPFLVNQFEKVDVQQKVREFTRLLVNPNGRPKTVELIFDYEPDKSYSVRYTGSLPIDRLVRMGEFVLPLTAFDPYAYHTTSTEDIIMDSDTSVMSEVLLDSVYSFNIASPQTLEVHNFSYYNTFPTIEIKGSFTSLTLSANGKSFSFGSQTDKTIEVSEFETKINGVNSLSAMTGESLEFIEGFNDVVITGSNINATITFKFKPRYL
jgi:phage-related protein